MDMNQEDYSDILRMKTCRITMENNMVVTQKTGNRPTSGPRYNTFKNIPKRCSITPQQHLFNYIHASFIHNSQNLETKELIKKMQYLFTMEYYSVFKNWYSEF